MGAAPVSAGCFFMEVLDALPCRIIPVHDFHHQAAPPHCYSLDSAVTLLCNAVTFWDISTLVLHLYTSFVFESEEIWTIKSLGITLQYFSWHTAFKENGLQFSHDGRYASWHHTVKCVSLQSVSVKTPLPL